MLTSASDEPSLKQEDFPDPAVQDRAEEGEHHEASDKDSGVAAEPGAKESIQCCPVCRPRVEKSGDHP